MDESGLLQVCPVCDYRLAGLPVEYHCPECGLEIDRRWEVFGGRKPLPLRSYLLALLVFLCILVFYVGAMFALPASLLPLLRVFSISIGLLVSLYMLRPRWHFVTLDRLEMRLHRRHRLLAVLPLCDVDNIELSPLGTRVRISLAGRSSSLPVSPFFASNRVPSGPSPHIARRTPARSLDASPNSASHSPYAGLYASTNPSIRWSGCNCRTRS